MMMASITNADSKGGRADFDDLIRIDAERQKK